MRLCKIFNFVVLRVVDLSGDLGHITRLDDEDVEEGDCRYLSREILKEEYDHLDKGDIFALGEIFYVRLNCCKSTN